MIKNPGARDLYGFLKAHEQMPGFAEELTRNDLDMIIRLLRDEYVGAQERSDSGRKLTVPQ